MTSRRRSKYLHDGNDNDRSRRRGSLEPENSEDYESDRARKRQRVEGPDAAEEAAAIEVDDDDDVVVDDAQVEDDGSEKEDEVYETAEEEVALSSDNGPDTNADAEDAGQSYDLILTESSKRKLKPLSAKSLERSQKAVRKTGVIYLSRVPPFMKPTAVRNLLTPYGEIGRVFLTPEDPAVHKKRVKSGGNKKKSFTDGWVEFIDKKHAKMVAETLNAQIIGGKKGGWYHDDVWNIKYLKGFKWHHLTEQIANENAERAARMRAEIAQTTRENKIFLDNVEKAKIMQTREAKRLKSAKSDDVVNLGQLGEEASVADTTSNKGAKGYRSHFKQSEVKLKAPKGKPIEQSEDVKRVLSKIF